MNYRFASACAAAALLAGAAVAAQPRADVLRSREGTWVMDSAYEILPDGTRTTIYGEHPLGLLNVDSAGRYNLQIFKMGRPTFVGGDKTHGTPDEFRQAVLGSSAPFGTVAIDRVKHQLVFDEKAASFPNWEGK